MDVEEHGPGPARVTDGVMAHDDVTRHRLGFD
jgi:hypothetical protein